MELKKGLKGRWVDLMRGYLDLPFNKIGYGIGITEKKMFKYKVLNKDISIPMIEVTKVWRLICDKRMKK